MKILLVLLLASTVAFAQSEGDEIGGSEPPELQAQSAPPPQYSDQSKRAADADQNFDAIMQKNAAPARSMPSLPPITEAPANTTSAKVVVPLKEFSRVSEGL